MLLQCQANVQRFTLTVQEYEYHSLQAGRLAQHLKSLDSVIVWVDYNPTSFGAHGKPILQCLKHINSVAHKQVCLYLLNFLNGGCGDVCGIISALQYTTDILGANMRAR